MSEGSPPREQTQRNDRDRRSRSPRNRPDRSPRRETVSNLFVSGLSSKTREEDLEHLFSKHGKVDKVKLITEPRTKESRGFAFVLMTTNAAVDECISKLDKIELDGRVITVEKARRERSRSPTPGRYLGRAKSSRPPPPGRGYGGGGYYSEPGYGHGYERERDRYRGGSRYSPYREGRRSRSPRGYYDRYERDRRSRSPPPRRYPSRSPPRR